MVASRRPPEAPVLRWSASPAAPSRTVRARPVQKQEGRRRQRRRSAPHPLRARASAPSATAARLDIACSVEPGRSTTAIGARSAIARQCRQRWNWRRLSAPMIQTNRTPAGAPRRARRACRRCSARRSGPRCRSRRRGGPPTRRRAAATRACRAASSACDFSGLPGVTSHQTRSRPSRVSASRVTSAWPSCGRIERAAEQADPHARREGRQAGNSGSRGRLLGRAAPPGARR